MAFNHNFWSQLINKDFPSQVRALVSTLDARILPSFSEIESEAESVQNECYEKLCSMPYDDRFDDGDLHESAFNAGLEHYQLMSGIQQGLINMFAASLYHLYEQQIMYFLRKEILHPKEQDNVNFLKQSVFISRLRSAGINIKSFPCYEKLDELSLLANTIKHGQGQSSKRLFSIRPDLFQQPSIISFGASGYHSVFTPLMGEDIYVSLKDINEYSLAIQEFWFSFYTALEKA
ncbi:Uncharacterised protein [Plesiomonas shigelloides]|uniref:hypothetical protein n=1 Tax=Plesiomonas shigelloides TaxID=703 RepID=UPI000D853543|nr:hypothetical protein [Plesiomonas shigelloides]SPZ37411.1 Uncharacterised protein [Plesiomonas shigelloides]